ncbi:hypothetical protein BGY98DRAFT_932901 [Russula aff. rugulosa BPL654]|nr:hypothetical protein BGY98DRAFT_932901 [Russula aff. rugulosa BPL654]
MAYTVFLFIERTFSSGLVSEAIQERRRNVYMRALDFHVLPGSPLLGLGSQSYGAYIWVLDFWLLAEAHSHDDDPDVAISAQCMAAAIATSVQERDQHWFHIVMRQLNISEDTLQTYLAHGDSVLLANLIDIIERLVPPHHDVDYTLNLDALIRHTLRIARNFDMAGTLPELQDRFCALWNRIAFMAHDDQKFRRLSDDTRGRFSGSFGPFTFPCMTGRSHDRRRSRPPRNRWIPSCGTNLPTQFVPLWLIITCIYPSTQNRLLL